MVMFSSGRVTDRTAYSISHEHALIVAGLCASTFKEEMPLPSKVSPDYRNVNLITIL